MVSRDPPASPHPLLASPCFPAAPTADPEAHVVVPYRYVDATIARVINRLEHAAETMSRPNHHKGVGHGDALAWAESLRIRAPGHDQ